MPDALQVGKCSLCPRTESLKICSTCGDRLYCSRACQVKDWESHKRQCSPTTRLDLASFYPILALMYACCHNGRPSNLAFRSQILNVPDSRCAPMMMAPDLLVTPVVLRWVTDRSDPNTNIWWPKAPNAEAETRLSRRLHWHGWLLQNYSILCITLLLTMYSRPTPKRATKKKPNLREKFGLSYHGIPIVDFGIAKGSIKVPPGSQYAFWFAPPNPLATVAIAKLQQAPDRHYWMYFTTILGRELILDCGMYTYGLGFDVRTDFIPQGIFNCPSRPPAYFVDKHVAVLDNKIRTTTQRFSVLHNPSLLRLSRPGANFALSVNDYKIILDFMENVKGKEITEVEEELIMNQIPLNCDRLTQVLTQRSWDGWPNEGLVGCDSMDDGVKSAQNYQDMPPHRSSLSNCALRAYLKLWINRKPQGRTQYLEEVTRKWRSQSI